MDFTDNKQIELAYKFVQYTNKNIFLTGKAGTGKTTFLNNLKTITPKRHVVVAPTGVAAINAGGVTIHSFFQLPFSPFIPEEAQNNIKDLNQLDYNKSSSSKLFKLRKNKVKIIKSLDLLIIDEISMVRADLLDAVDAVLRRYRNNNLPFGGVQLLMIGDLHQLSPVVKEEEWRIVRNIYKTVYFFSSLALKKTNFVTIELKKIYRQEDETFIKILGEIRDNKLSSESISTLNKRVKKEFSPEDKEGYITLTTHNATASEINERKHIKLKGRAYKFKADITGDFPEFIYPTAETLELKVGAQVMFIKNDSSFDKLYYNGKIGKIISIEDDIISVKCPGDYSEIPVSRVEWENIKYQYNDKTKSIDEKKVGSFEQFPLKLAWAITVHKSQGLTFDKAIIDINSAFAFGQAYVALSRCRSMEGMVLTSAFCENNIKSDYNIADFTQNTRENQPNKGILEQSMKVYQQRLILDLFDFTSIRKTFFYIKKLIKENIRSFDMAVYEEMEKIQKNAEVEIFQINKKFIRQLVNLFTDAATPQENIKLQDRIKKASEYFIGKLNDVYIEPVGKFVFDPDNKELNKSICEALKRFELELFIKTECLQKSAKEFDSIELVKTVANAELDFKPKFNKHKAVTKSYDAEDSLQALYNVLNAWRKSVAEDEELPVYMVMPHKSLKELVDKLPSSQKELRKIKGFGKVKSEKYGYDILDIINEFCFDNNIERDVIDFDTNIDKVNQVSTSKDSVKKDVNIKRKKSHEVSYEMFCDNKNIKEIAEERNLVESTILGHLLKFVKDGKLDGKKLIDLDDYEEIVAVIEENPDAESLKIIFEKCNGKFSYDQIRIAYADNIGKNNQVP